MIGHFHIKFDKIYVEVLQIIISNINDILEESQYHNIKNIKLYKDGLITIEVELFPEDDG